MQISLHDLRNMALDRIRQAMERPGVDVQSNVSAIVRKGTLVQDIRVYDHELMENKDRLDQYLHEKMYDAAQLMQIPIKPR